MTENHKQIDDEMDVVIERIRSRPTTEYDISLQEIHWLINSTKAAMKILMKAADPHEDAEEYYFYESMIAKYESMLAGLAGSR